MVSTVSCYFCLNYGMFWVICHKWQGPLLWRTQLYWHGVVIVFFLQTFINNANHLQMFCSLKEFAQENSSSSVVLCASVWWCSRSSFIQLLVFGWFSLKIGVSNTIFVSLAMACLLLQFPLLLHSFIQATIDPLSSLIIDDRPSWNSILTCFPWLWWS